MNATQQKQLKLDLGAVESHRDRSPEAFIAERLAESPTGEVRLMESICERQNMNRALKRVRENRPKRRRRSARNDIIVRYKLGDHV